MSFGIDVDTLSLTFDKLQYIFNGFGQIRESFLETTTKYKQEGISDAEFFDKVLEGVMRFSALEFLAIKAVFEIKKSAGTDRMKHGVETTPPPAIAQISPPGHSIESFITPATLPNPQHHNTMMGEKRACQNCGNGIKVGAKFCPNCGRES